MTSTTLVIALTVQSLAFIAVIVFVLRHQAARQVDHDSAIAALAGQAQVTNRRLIETIEAERDARRAETQTLLQRIQAPQAAVLQHAADTSEPPQATYALDDEEQAEAQDDGLLVERTLEMIRQAEAEQELAAS